MTLEEAAKKIGELEDEIRLAREEAHSAKVCARYALKYIQKLAIGLDGTLPGARAISEDIKLEFGDLG